MNTVPQWTVLAHLLRPQGRRGEILADLLTDFPDHFTRRGRLFLAPPGFLGSSEEAKDVTILASWFPKGRNEGRIVLEIAHCVSIKEAEALVGLDLVTLREDRIPLATDENYISDLIGCDLYDGGYLAGVVEDVRFPSSTDGRTRLDVAPWLVVKTPHAEETLVPFAKDLVVSIDTAGRRITMNLPDGLLLLGDQTEVEPPEDF